MLRQNRTVVGAKTREGQPLDARHVQVVIGFWPNMGMNVPPKVRTTTWYRWHLLYTVAGKGLLTWPGGKLAMTPRKAVLLWPHTEYTYIVDPETQQWSQYSVEFLPRAHWHEWLHWPEVAPGIMSLDVTDPSIDKQLRDTWSQAIMIADTPRPLWEDFALAAVEKILLTFRGFSPSRPESKHDHVSDPRLRTAIEFMEKNQAKPIHRDQIASAAEVSPSYLGILFQKHLRTTPKQYLDMLRINTAHRLLRETTERVSEVGRHVGYDDLATFCYRFRQLTGQTPGEYRESMKK